MSPGRSLQSNILSINSVRVDSVSLSRVLDSLDRTQAQVPNNRRGTHRMRFRIRNAILLPTPGDRSVVFIVPTRNLSAEGMSILHGQMMHLGQSCTVQLPARGGWIVTTATVVRCRHVRAMLHEVGLKFENPIDVQRLNGPSAP